jgi:outer membrane lipoprotein-sorting protein
VSDLAELLELMHTSARRWQTIRASGWEWHHRVQSQLAWQRLIPRDRSRTITFVGKSERELEPEEVREPWRLWLAQPDKVRTEFMAEDETITAVILGNTWWSWSQSREVATNQGDPDQTHGRGPGDALIDASSILPAVELVLMRRASFIGRPVLEVLATPTPPDDNDEEAWDWRHATHDLGGGADEYTLMVDAERGVLLRSEARIGDQPFRIIWMETVAFDQELGDDVFAPPSDRDIEPAWVPRAVSLTDLPNAVPFTVLVPEHPPFGVEEVDIHPPDRRYGNSEQIHIGFASNFLGEDDRQFWLVESAAPLPERRAMEWREADAMRFGEDRDIDPPLRIVQLERLGTHVEVRSYHLEVEELLDLASTLVPMRDEPPTLHVRNGA